MVQPVLLASLPVLALFTLLFVLLFAAQAAGVIMTQQLWQSAPAFEEPRGFVNACVELEVQSRNPT
jgi:hypothetical protein